jgi:RHS repeat-associated protein
MATKKMRAAKGGTGALDFGSSGSKHPATPPNGGLGHSSYPKPHVGAFNFRAQTQHQASKGINWETAPGEWETGFVYMRNRYYDPELGRFISADPLGYVDGPSLYGFAGNTPYNSSDPMGLYQKDFHYYVVYYMALLALRDPDRAERIAFASQYVDDFDDSTPMPDSPQSFDDPKYLGTLRDFHFPEYFGGMVVAGYENELIRFLKSRAVESGDDLQLGVFFHSFADSFSHAGFGALRTEINDRGHPVPAVGHFHAGETPDHPFEAPLLATEAALQIYDILREYGKRHGIIQNVPKVDREKLRQTLTKKFKQFRGGKHLREVQWKYWLWSEGVPVSEYSARMRASDRALFKDKTDRQRIWVQEFGKKLGPQYGPPKYVQRFWKDFVEEGLLVNP